MIDTTGKKTRQLAAEARGDRLTPSPDSRAYWHLVSLRDSYKKAIATTLQAGDKKILIDLGCGNMPYKSLFPVDNYIGADFSGNELADIHICDDGTVPVASQSASIVLSSQVLEHVENVVAYLAEAKRLLADNGLLFLSTHGVWRYHPDPRDYWRWTCDGLKLVLAQAGFDIIYFKGVMGPEATALQLWQDSVAPRIPRKLLKLFYRFIQWRMETADLRCPDHIKDTDACVYVLVAQKRL